MPTAPDTTPPSAPTGLSATAASGTQVNLGWTAATDNSGVTGYRVERCTGAGCTNFAEVATPTGDGAQRHRARRIDQYRYRVRAVDAAGNLGAYSAIAIGTTPRRPTRPPPTAPSGLDRDRRSAPARSTWPGPRRPTTSASPATGSSAARARGARTWRRSRRRPRRASATPGWPRTPLPLPGARRRRRRQPGRVLGDRERRRTLAADTTAPSAPTGLTATPASPTQVNLAWTASTDNVGVTGYRVERCQGASCTTFAQIATPTATSYTDTGVSARPRTATGCARPTPPATSAPTRAS